MALYPGLTLTEAGIQMIAESQLNETKLIITKAKIGDGDLPVGHDISKMTDVLSPKLEAPFSSFKNLGNGQIDIKFAVSNAELEAGFFAKEIGIFASLEDGTETLYAYTNAGNKTGWIADKSTPIDSQIIECQLVIGNAPNVVINITDKAYALAEDLAKHEESAESHKDLFDNKADKLENGHVVVRSVNNQYADDNGNVNLDGFQVGDIKWTSANLTQAGFLVANGASVRRDTYPDLFSAIGTRWGAVDDEHFNLPNLIGRFAEGSETAGGYKEAGLPNIEGQFGGAVRTDGVEVLNGSLRINAADTSHLFDLGNNPDYREATVDIDASRSNQIYGNSDTVQPNSALLTPYIKAFAGASATSTDIEITKVANDVADKADRDLSNLSENGRKAFFPSDTFIELPLTGDNNRRNYEGIAPANGFINAIGNATNVFENFELRARGSSLNNGNSYAPFIISNSAYGGICHSTIPVKKGDKIEFISSTNGKIVYSHLRFIYAEGEV